MQIGKENYIYKARQNEQTSENVRISFSNMCMRKVMRVYCKCACFIGVVILPFCYRRVIFLTPSRFRLLARSLLYANLSNMNCNCDRN